MPEATRSGYKFDGWYTAASGWTKVSPETIVTTDVTLYALWSISTAKVFVSNVEVQQRYPWNGLVDIVVTIQGSAEDVSKAVCSFAATNSATKASIPVVHITRDGDDTGSETVWTRKFIWDAKADVGAVRIDDVVLTVNAKIQGCVQLWENGPYWAECNVGASQPEECGYYFWWGDTVGYKRNANNDGWVSVKDSTEFSFSSGNCPTYGKANSQLQSEGYIDASGYLDAAHDAATVHLGAPWRMPTDVEFSALTKNCTTKWMARNGVVGLLVTGTGAFSSKSIFLPAAGYGFGSDLRHLGSYGRHWSSRPSSADSTDTDAWDLYFNSDSGIFYTDYYYYYYDSRYNGQSVRPVCGFANPGVAIGGAATHLPLDFSRGTVLMMSVTAQQRNTWSGIVDITVTIQGLAEDVAKADCLFVATNSATRSAIPVEHITHNGDDSGSDNVWTRKFIWDAYADVGAMKIDDIELTVDFKPLGGLQLWENGPYWAECNIGASQPEESGYYFWWGDTTGYKRNASSNGWVSVKDSTGYSFSSVNCPTHNKSISQLQSLGYIDAAGNLVAAYDAATEHLGAPWRMPTYGELSALLSDCCTKKWTTRNGVYGLLVTGKDAYASKSIFIPAAGAGFDSYLSYSSSSYSSSSGYYWSSTPNSLSDEASFLHFNCTLRLSSTSGRMNGQSVRPVRGFADPSVTIGRVTTHLSLDCQTFYCTVRLDPNGGTCSTVSKSYESGNLIGVLPEATWRGHMFDGWYTAAIGGTKVSVETRVTTDMILYAHWIMLPDKVLVTNVEAQQRYPWNGLVDITVTLYGEVEDVIGSGCWFTATNSATKAVLPVTHVTQNGADTGSGFTWTRKYIWDTNADVGEVKIEDVALAVKLLGGVQLWKDGPYWAQCNVGATKPEESGYYFWWGDTAGAKRNSAGTGLSHDFDGCPTYGKDYWELEEAGYIDSTHNLVAAHDAATVRLGAPWRMPTSAEFLALVQNCDTEWTTCNGVSGRLVKGRGDYASRSIFLPAVGRGWDDRLSYFGSDGEYWSSIPNQFNVYDGKQKWIGYDCDDAVILRFNSIYFERSAIFRDAGLPVRPVWGFAK